MDILFYFGSKHSLLDVIDDDYSFTNGDFDTVYFWMIHYFPMKKNFDIFIILTKALI